MTRQEIDNAHRTSLIIVMAMVTGQLLFAAAAWYLRNRDETMPTTEGLTNPMTLAWLAVSFGSLAVAFTLRGQVTDLDRPEKRERIRTGEITLATVQTRILIMFAVLEGAGLLGITNYLVNGQAHVLLGAIGFLALTTAAFFPKRDWFDAFVS